MKDDYEELEGKIFTMGYEDGSEQVKVVGAHRDIGITACSVDDPNELHICLNRKIHSTARHGGEEKYNAMFDCYIIAIEHGFVDAGDMLFSFGYRNGGYINQVCAFI